MTNTVRTCGNCSTCCFTHSVGETLKKPTNLWCKYIIAGKGCGIYGNHPTACRQYRCEWLEGFGDELDRPDQLGVVFDRLILGSKYGPEFGKLDGRTMLIAHEAVHGAASKERGATVIEEARASGEFVAIVRFGGKETTLLLPKDVDIDPSLLYAAAREGFIISTKS